MANVAQPAAATLQATAFTGTAATVEGQTDSGSGRYQVTLAAGLQAPNWAAADFEQTKTSGTDDESVVTLSAAGLAKLQAANPSYTFSAANIKPGELAGAPAAVDASAAKSGAASAHFDVPSSVDQNQASTQRTSIDAAAAIAEAKQLSQGAQKTVAQLDTYVTQDNELASQSASDNIPHNDALTALQTHVGDENDQVLALTANVSDDVSEDPAATLSQLTQAAQILNTMNEELTQAASMLDTDRNGAPSEAASAAQTALDALTLPAGTSGKVNTYGDLILNAASPADYQAAVDVVKGSGELKSFRQVVDPDTDALTDAAGTVFGDIGQTHNLVVSVDANTGDKITVSIPKAFLSQSDSVMNVSPTTLFNAGYATDAAGVNRLINGLNTFTYTADTAGTHQFNITITLGRPYGKDSDTKYAYPQDTQLPITLRHGQTVKTLTYTLDNGFSLQSPRLNLHSGYATSASNVSIDSLVTNQVYEFTITSNGQGDPLELKTTVSVPEGFVVDAVTSDFGDLAETSTNGATYTFSQPGGAGTPVVVSTDHTYNPSTLSAFNLLGHYTKVPVDNSFTVTQVLGSTTVTAKQSFPLVKDDTSANVKVALEHGTDSLFSSPNIQNNEVVKVDPSGNVLTSPQNFLDVPVNSGDQLTNNSNIALTNFAASFAIEPGTIINDDSSTSGLGKLFANVSSLTHFQLIVTHSNGQQETFSNLDSTGQLSSQVNGKLTGAFDDVTNITLKADRLLPGESVQLYYRDYSLIKTDKAVGDVAHYPISVTSEQLTQNFVNDRQIIAPVNINYSVSQSFTALVQMAPNDLGVLRPGDVVILGDTLIPTPETASGVYGDSYFIVPTGFSVVSATAKIGNLTGKVDDLGNIGPGGADVLKFSLAQLAGQASGRANISVQVQVNDNTLPGTYTINDAFGGVFVNEYIPAYGAATPVNTMTIAGQPVKYITDNNRTFKYSFLVPLFLGSENGIDDPATSSVAYLTYSDAKPDATTAHLSRGATPSEEDDTNAANIQLASVNTTTNSAPWSDNLINLPTVQDGDHFTIVLTGPGTLSPNSPAGSKLLYSSKKVTPDPDGSIDLSSFSDVVSEDKWDTVKTVVLQTGKLSQNDVASAILPVKVPSINTVIPGKIANLTTTFVSPKANGETFMATQPLAVEVNQDTAVTTEYVAANPDGSASTHPIAPPVTRVYKAGDNYETTPLATVPAGYDGSQVNQPANAQGIIAKNQNAITVTYIYPLATFKASVNYVDDNNDEAIVKTDHLTGKLGAVNNYSLVKAANEGGLTALGYVIGKDDLPAGDLIVFNQSASGDQTYTVHLSHKMVTVTPSAPGNPGQPIDPANPGVLWPAGSDKQSLQKTITESIHYSDDKADPQAPDHIGTVVFDRNGTVDAVTGKVTYDAWTAQNGDTTFDAVRNPVVSGMVTQTNGVGPVGDVTVEAGNLDHTVVYQTLGAWVSNLPDVSAITYPNDPTDPTRTAAATDAKYPTIPYKAGYTAKDAQGNALKPADPQHPEKGYIPPAVPSDLTANTPITYAKNKSMINIVYLDNTTHQWLATDHENGAYGNSSAYHTSTRIKQFEAAGYQLVDDGYPAGVVFGDHAQTYVVHLKHGTITVTPNHPGEPGKPVDPKNPAGVKWPAGTDKSALEKVVTETIHYVDQTGKTLAPDHLDRVIFSREAVVDEVLGSVRYSPWTAENDDTTFDAVKNPLVSGYKADYAGVGAVGDITAQAANIVHTVVYTAIEDGDNPGTPGGNNPGNPGDNTPGTPDGNNSGNPGDNNPATPDGNNPGNPGDNNPGTPDDNNSVNPGEDNSDTTTDNNPGNPEGNNPDAPGGDNAGATPGRAGLPETGSSTGTTPSRAANLNNRRDQRQAGDLKQSEEKRLPSTGDVQSQWLVSVGLSLAALLGLASLDVRRRKQD